MNRLIKGFLPIQRNSKQDWETIWESAKTGDIESVTASVRVQSYSALRRISADYATARFMDRTCVVYVGPTGTGKSHRAWEEAGPDAFSKCPRTKWWTSYQGQENVVIDEFRGVVDISHLLRWLDRYPVHVETKGSSLPLCARKFWITSNLHPDYWYPELDTVTQLALMRRLTIIEMNTVYVAQ